MDQILGRLLQNIATLLGEKTVIEVNMDPDNEDAGYLSVKNKNVQITFGTKEPPKKS